MKKASPQERARVLVDDWCGEWSALDRERLQRQIAEAIEAAMEEDRKEQQGNLDKNSSNYRRYGPSE